ncbi:MAG: hypothetical protein H6922_04015 [Pseudomonadaceae bacterium]|nr:hypothetical protein [Pseudomonadaceae bacterium]
MNASQAANGPLQPLFSAKSGDAMLLHWEKTDAVAVEWLGKIRFAQKQKGNPRTCAMALHGMVSTFLYHELYRYLPGNSETARLTHAVSDIHAHLGKDTPPSRQMFGELAQSIVDTIPLMEGNPLHRGEEHALYALQAAMNEAMLADMVSQVANMHVLLGKNQSSLLSPRSISRRIHGKAAEYWQEALIHMPKIETTGNVVQLFSGRSDKSSR